LKLFDLYVDEESSALNKIGQMHSTVIVRQEGNSVTRFDDNYVDIKSCSLLLVYGVEAVFMLPDLVSQLRIH
jgi:hypothetical protein